MVNYKSRIPLSIAALSMALFLPELTHAQSTSNMQAPQNTSKQSWTNNQNSLNQPATQAERQEAQEMVPAQAYLRHGIDAKNCKAGSRFTATLAKDVQLKNGPKLDRGTELIGTVATEIMHKDNTRLALRITQARTKDGKLIPLKATVVGIYAPESENVQGFNVAPGQEAANDWTPKTLKVDQLNAVKGVDLHSTIDGRNSAVFVSNKKEDVKISAGSELALAIAQSGKQMNQSGSNGMS
jgi:hypothetical protein